MSVQKIKGIQHPRVTLLIGVRHQLVGKPATGTQFTSSSPLEFDDNPYSRTLKIGPEWVPLDVGWLEGKVGLIQIENLKPLRQVYPTDEEKEEDAAKVLLIRFSSTSPGDLVVLPGLATIFQVHPSTRIEVSCVLGYTTEVRYTINPR